MGHETLERLDAITTLGGRAGYDLALEDLRIREAATSSEPPARNGEGAPKPTYHSILEEIGRLRESLPSSSEVTADIPCLIPSDYIPQSRFG